MPANERLLDGIHALMFVKYAEKQLKAINSLSQISGSRPWRVASRDNKPHEINTAERRQRVFVAAAPPLDF
jgi:hypothetical protein